jgi:hypothetical protein
MMSYRIDRGRRLVEVVGTGDLTGEEITAIQAEMAADPEFDPTFAALVDFGAANFSAVPPSTARDHAEQHPFDPASPVAVLVASDYDSGMVRLFASFTELMGGDGHVRAFRDRKSALAWIEAVRNGAADDPPTGDQEASS